MPDPVGEVTGLRYRPSGIQVGHMRVPLGVIGIIYESRPNVTADAGALCLKSGNACILRGGSESLRLEPGDRRVPRARASRPRACPRTRSSSSPPPTAPPWASWSRWSDTSTPIVPRGGKGLIERVAREARVPVIKHLDGICHVYIDDRADPAKAIAIADNAKTQRYGTCNTMETLLVAQAIAPPVLPKIGKIYAQKGVEMRCCPESRAILEKAGVAERAGGDRRGLPHRVAGAGRLDRARSPASTRRSRTSPRTARSTPTPSSPRTGRARSASCARSTRAR